LGAESGEQRRRQIDPVSFDSPPCLQRVLRFAFIHAA
jgi:hypothetical protein